MDVPKLDPRTEAILRRWPMIAAVMLFFLLVAVVVIPVAQNIRVIHRIEALGGKVGIEPGWLRKNMPNEWLYWLSEKNGEDWLRSFEPIVDVSFAHGSGRLVTDSDLILLKGIAQLEWLNLNGTKVTDAGLAHLKGLTHLETLHLDETNVTGAGLIHLKGMNQLKKLYLLNTKVTDADLIHLNRMTQLRYLYLKRTQITIAGARRLQAALPKCDIRF